MTSTQSKFQSKAAADASRASLQTGVLQRKCCCGNHTIAGGECGECSKKHLSLQRVAQISQPDARNSQLATRNSGGAAPTVDVLRSPDQPRNATTRAFAEPRFAYDFTQVDSHKNYAAGVAVQRKPLNGSFQEEEAETVDSSVESGIPRPIRSIMERRFGTSFSDVQVHADADAGRTALEMGAKAYTKGPEIYFAPGYFQPYSQSGLGLIAHELAHVVQQRNGRFPVTQTSNRGAQIRNELEDEADEAAAVFASSYLPVEIRGTTIGTQVQPSLLDEVLGLRERLGGGIEGIAAFVISQAAGQDPLIAELASLRDQLRGLTSIRLPRDVVVEIEGTYNRLRSLAPDWLPTPHISFAGAPVQRVAVVDDIAIFAILLFLLFLIIMLWYLMRTNPRIRREQDEAVNRAVDSIREGIREALHPRRGVPPAPTPETRPEPRTEPRAEPRTEPRTRPRRPTEEEPPRPIPFECPGPTGLTPLDPILMDWYKVKADDWYPPHLQIQGHQYDRDAPGHLPHGEPIGVSEEYWPRIGKLLPLLPEREGSARRDFRAVLAGYGFDWAGRQVLQADHVQDLQWGGADAFENLWPMDAIANESAGQSQNNQQRVTFCETARGPFRVGVRLVDLKREARAGKDFFGRWFAIRRVVRGPD